MCRLCIIIMLRITTTTMVRVLLRRGPPSFSGRGGKPLLASTANIDTYTPII